MLLGCCSPAVSRGSVVEVMGDLHRGCDGEPSIPMASLPRGVSVHPQSTATTATLNPSLDPALFQCLHL